MVYQCWNTTKKFCRLFFLGYGLYANVTQLSKVFLSLETLSYFLCCAQKRKSCQQTDRLPPDCWGLGGSSQQHTRLGPTHLSSSMDSMWRPHKCALLTYLLAWHPATQYSWLQSNPICQKTFFSKMQFCFKPKCNMGFVNHKNSHSNYSMMPLMMLPMTEQQPEQMTCEILEKNQ